VCVTSAQIADLRSALNAIPPDDYATWIKMGQALVELGDMSRELWLSWSQMSEKWRPEDALKWSTFTADRIGYKAVFTEARGNGWINPASSVATGGSLADAISCIEGAIASCKKDPRALGTDDFNHATRQVCKEAPAEWHRLRVAIKDAKPSGVSLASIDAATRPESERAGEPTVADFLVTLVREKTDLFHAKDRTAYATLRNGPPCTFKLDTKAFSEWLSYAYFQATATDERSGHVASEPAINTARTVLTGIAAHEGDERRVFLRTAQRGEAYYLDLGNDDWNAVEVTRDGWRVVARPPVRFWRSSTLRALPMPISGGDLSLLWRYANIPEEARPLVLAWLLDAWRPETNFAVLELTGQQGAAKSSTQGKLRLAWISHGGGA